MSFSVEMLHLFLLIMVEIIQLYYSKTLVKRPLKNRQNKDLNDILELNEGREHCRMLPLVHSAILLTCIKR